MSYFRFRRTFGVIPGVRLNLSRSGPSVSLGPRGLHYTIGLSGTRTTVGIPGSRLFWNDYRPYSGGGHQKTEQSTAQNGDNPSRYESAPIEEQFAKSTSELAPILDAARKQWRFSNLILVVAVAIAVIGLTLQSVPILVGATVFGMVAWPATYIFDRRRLTVTMQYELQSQDAETFDRLSKSFRELANCARLWRIPIEINHHDWKRNAGSERGVQRQPISIGFGTPSLIKSNLQFPMITLGNQSMYFAPDVVLSVARRSVAALAYGDLIVSVGQTQFIEDEQPPADASVVGYTWQFVNRNGQPDRRFSNNRQIPVCLYDEIHLDANTGLHERIHCSRSGAAAQFASSIDEMKQRHPTEQHHTNEVVQEKEEATRSLVPTIARAVKDQSGEIAVAFANETENARTLALGHGKLWEFLLVEELLKSKMSVLRGEYDEFENLKSVPKRRFNRAEFMSWMGSETTALASTITKMKSCIEKELPDALGKPGFSGDAIQMLRTVDEFFDYCGSFLAFELDMCAADPPAEFKAYAGAFRGITSWVIGVVQRLVDDWSEAVNGLRQGSHEFQIEVQLKDCPQLEKASAEIDKATSTKPKE